MEPSDYSLLDELVMLKLKKEREIRDAKASIDKAQSLLEILGAEPKKMPALRSMIRSLVGFELTA